MAEKINSETLQVTSFDIIFHSGNARTLIHEAFRSMRKEMFEEVEEKLRQANEEILHAHQSQTQLLKEYASGTKIEMEIIMVHAQDHLMTTMLLKDTIRHLFNIYKKA